MTISVIIPVYNSEKTIAKCLNSAILQTCSVDEIILIDDGSTDLSKEIIFNIIVENPSKKIIYYSQKNAGPSRARNKGIELATSDYIAFLDSDDYWSKDKIKHQYEILKDTTIDCLASLNKINEIKLIEVSFKSFLLKNYYRTSTFIGKTTVIRNYYFDENRKYAEDYLLWLFISYKYKCMLLIGYDDCKIVNFDKSGIYNRNSLSSQLWCMTKGELENYETLYHYKMIKQHERLLYSFFSLLKYIRRLIIKIAKL